MLSQCCTLTNAGTKLRRRRLLASGSNQGGFGEAMGAFAGFLIDGGLTGPFCVGDQANCDAGDAVRSVFGDAKASLSYDMEILLSAESKRVQFGALAQATIGELARTALGPLGEIGMQDVSANVTYAPEYVQLRMKAKPLLNIPTPCGDLAECALATLGNTVENLVVLATASVFPTGEADAELQIALPPEDHGTWAFTDQNGDRGVGIAIAVASGPPLETSVAMQMPVKVCSEGCESGSTVARRDLFLEGEVRYTTSVTMPDGMYSGKFTMKGWWFKALTCPMLHLNNVLAEIGFKATPTGPFPLKIKVGGQLCIGKKESCENNIEAKTFQGAAFVGMDQRPDQLVKDNFFIAMVQAITVKKLFGVMSDAYANEQLGAVSKQLPDFVLDSGIFPFKDGAECGSDTFDGPVPLTERDCFARFSYAEASQLIPLDGGGNLVVPMGTAIAGQMTLLGQNLRVDARVGPTKFYIDADMSPLTLGPLQLGRSDSGQLDMSRGPRLYIDLEAPGSGGGHAAVYFSAGFSIPLLQTTGTAEVRLGRGTDPSTPLFKIHTTGKILGEDAEWWLQADGAQPGTSPSTQQDSLLGPIGKVACRAKLKTDGPSGVAIKIFNVIKGLIDEVLNIGKQIAEELKKALRAGEEEITKIQDKLAAVCDAFSDEDIRKGCHATLKAGDLAKVMLSAVGSATTAAMSGGDALSKIVGELFQGAVGSSVVDTLKWMENIFHVHTYDISMAVAAAGPEDLGVKIGCKLMGTHQTVELGSFHQGRRLASTLSAAAQGVDPFDFNAVAQHIFDDSLTFFSNFEQTVKDEAGKIFGVADEALKKATKAADDMWKTISSCNFDAQEPNGCASGKTKSTTAAGVQLCFTNCASGYARSSSGGIDVDVCVKTNACPSGWTETHAACMKPKGHWRAETYCPSGYTDWVTHCAKTTYSHFPSSTKYYPIMVKDKRYYATMTYTTSNQCSTCYHRSEFDTKSVETSRTCGCSTCWRHYVIPYACSCSTCYSYHDEWDGCPSGYTNDGAYHAGDGRECKKPYSCSCKDVKVYSNTCPSGYSHYGAYHKGDGRECQKQTMKQQGTRSVTTWTHTCPSGYTHDGTHVESNAKVCYKTCVAFSFSSR